MWAWSSQWVYYNNACTLVTSIVMTFETPSVMQLRVEMAACLKDVLFPMYDSFALASFNEVASKLSDYIHNKYPAVSSTPSAGYIAQIYKGERWASLTCRTHESVRRFNSNPVNPSAAAQSPFLVPKKRTTLSHTKLAKLFSEELVGLPTAQAARALGVGYGVVRRARSGNSEQRRTYLAQTIKETENKLKLMRDELARLDGTREEGLPEETELEEESV